MCVYEYIVYYIYIFEFLFTILIVIVNFGLLFYYY